MLAVFIGFGIRLWLASSDPDNDVHTSSMASPDIGEFFMNTTTGELFLCYRNVVSDQLWQSSTNEALVQSMIDAIPQSDWTQLNSSASDFIKNKPSLATVATTGAYSDLSGKPSLSIVATSGSYNDLSNKPSIPASQIQSDWTQSNSSAVDFIKNKPASKNQSSASRSLNTVFQISATQWSSVSYSVNISTTVSLSGAQSGTVILEIASDSGFTTNIQTLQEFSNGNSGVLVIGLVLTQLATACLTGQVPPGYYVRLRTVNVTGTPTFTFRAGQEVVA